MNIFNRKKVISEIDPYTLTCPCIGNVLPLSQVKDEMFSTETLGKGLAIVPKKATATLVAPISGTISMLFPTKHAIGITSDSGIEILLHIGINTVELNGKFFETLVQQGQRVNRGDSLIKVNFKKIKDAGYDISIMMIITNTQNYKDIQVMVGKHHIHESILHVEKGASL